MNSLWKSLSEKSIAFINVTVTVFDKTCSYISMFVYIHVAKLNGSNVISLTWIIDNNI